MSIYFNILNRIYKSPLYDYQLTLTDTETGCVRVYGFTVDNLVATQAPLVLHGLRASVHPQPTAAGQRAVLHFESRQTLTTSLALYDAAGRQLLTVSEVAISAGSSSYALPVLETPGIYAVILGGERVVRVVVR